MATGTNSCSSSGTTSPSWRSSSSRWNAQYFDRKEPKHTRVVGNTVVLASCGSGVGRWSPKSIMRLQSMLPLLCARAVAVFLFFFPRCRQSFASDLFAPVFCSTPNTLYFIYTSLPSQFSPLDCFCFIYVSSGGGVGFLRR